MKCMIENEFCSWAKYSESCYSDVIIDILANIMSPDTLSLN